jgi:hypothetical protein
MFTPKIELLCVWNTALGSGAGAGEDKFVVLMSISRLARIKCPARDEKYTLEEKIYGFSSE